MVWVPWEDFKATYRGKEKKDARRLKTGEVRRVGIMMRRYVGFCTFYGEDPKVD